MTTQAPTETELSHDSERQVAELRAELAKRDDALVVARGNVESMQAGALRTHAVLLKQNAVVAAVRRHQADCDSVGHADWTPVREALAALYQPIECVHCGESAGCAENCVTRAEESRE